ncbi:MAG: hypothetical protein ACOYK9_06820 [Chlamydiia bacterium]
MAVGLLGLAGAITCFTAKALYKIGEGIHNQGVQFIAGMKGSEELPPESFPQ